MISRPNTCEGCPLHKTSVPGFCPDKIPPNAKYLLFAEAPGKTEIAQGEPMCGKAGFVLHNWILKSVSLLKLAWERNEMGIANVLRCLPKEVQGRPYPKGEDKELAEAHCRQYDRIPDSVHTIILLGEHSQRLMFNKELEAEDKESAETERERKGVMGRIGRVIEKDGRRFVFAPHPAFVLRQPAIVQHAQESFRIAANEERVVEPEQLNWDYAIKELL